MHSPERNKKAEGQGKKEGDKENGKTDSQSRH